MRSLRPNPMEKVRWEELLDAALDLCNGVSLQMRPALERRLLIRLDNAAWAAAKKKKKTPKNFKHYHVSNHKDDACASCGLDIRNTIHKRMMKGK